MPPKYPESYSKKTKRFRLLKGYLTDVNKYLREREDSSGSEDDRDRESVTFAVGDEFPNVSTPLSVPAIQTPLAPSPLNCVVPISSTPVNTINVLRTTLSYPPQLVHQGNSVER